MTGKRVLECGAMSEELTDEQIRDEVDKFLTKQIALSRLRLVALSRLRLVLLVNGCEEAKGSESNDEMSV